MKRSRDAHDRLCHNPLDFSGHFEFFLQDQRGLLKLSVYPKFSQTSRGLEVTRGSNEHTQICPVESFCSRFQGARVGGVVP